jgi:hypothetical protein
MTKLETLGTYSLVSYRPEHAGRAKKIDQDRIGAIVARQVAIRGNVPFTFKALGFKWRYEPEGK